MRAHLLDLLTSLHGVRQSKRHHPEGDALFHSLQVFEAALADTSDGELLAAALLHDIGKAISAPEHAHIGAQLLKPHLSDRVVWLVAHHMDLLHHPRRTRRKLRRDPRLRELEALRRWDLAGRDPYARTMLPSDAIDLMMDHLQPFGLTATSHDKEYA